MASDNINILAELLEKATEKNIQIACAESCTGGLLAASLTELPGSSATFDRGVVTYSNAAKMDLLGVSADTITEHGAVSEEVAAEMAQGILARSEAQLALSITGIAGPGGSDHKPEGRVCFGIATARHTSTETQEFGPLGRTHVRHAARDHALAQLLAAIHEMPKT